MKWLFSLFGKQLDDQDRARVERYKHYREVGRNLNMTLAKLVPKPAVPECGKKLGIYKAGTLILNNEDEIAILYDYCLYHYRRAGKTMIERYLEQTPPPAGSDEELILQAMLKAHYSVFRIEDIKPHQGAVLRDLVADATVNLMDIGLSETGMPGAVLTGRLLPVEDFHMSSGTIIPVPEGAFEQSIEPVIRKFLRDKTPGDGPLFSPTQEASFVAQLIRVALHAGGEDNSFYTDIEQ